MSKNSYLGLGISILLGSFVLTGCGKLPGFSDVKLCENPTGQTCEAETTTFARNTKKLYVTANLLNVPQGKNVTIVWKDKGDPAKEVTFGTTTVNVKGKTLQASLTPKRLPEGAYEVILSIDDKNSSTTHKEFVVLSSQEDIKASKANGINVSTAKLANIKMCVDPPEKEGCATDTPTFDTMVPKLFVTADLNNAPDGTKVKFIWRVIEGEAGEELDIDSVNFETKNGENLVRSFLSAENGFPPGKYEVIGLLNADNSKPVRKEFSVVPAK